MKSDIYQYETNQPFANSRREICTPIDEIVSSKRQGTQVLQGVHIDAHDTHFLDNFSLAVSAMTLKELLEILLLL